MSELPPGSFRYYDACCTVAHPRKDEDRCNCQVEHEVFVLKAYGFWLKMAFCLKVYGLWLNTQFAFLKVCGFEVENVCFTTTDGLGRNKSFTLLSKLIVFWTEIYTTLPTGYTRLPSRHLPTSYIRLGGYALGTSACTGLWESTTFWARLGPSSLKGLAFGCLANELTLQGLHSKE